MTSLDQFAEANSPATAPTGDWKARTEFDGQQGYIISQPRADEPATEELLRDWGYDPEKVEIVGPFKFSRWQSASGTWLSSYRATIQSKSDYTLDLPALFAEVRNATPTKVPQYTNSGKALVVVWADLQVGKTDHRGGTKELILRVQEKLDALEARIKADPCDTAYLLDVGDVLEGFENVKSQMFGNDLSLPDMLDLVVTLELKVILLLARYHKRVVVSGVSSNHCGWRKGSDYLSSDPSRSDWGLTALRIVRQAVALNPALFEHVEFVDQENYQNSVVLPIYGEKVGITHGDSAKTVQKLPDWWKGQVHGNMPLATASILLVGHYHHFNMTYTGRHVETDKPKVLIVAPTLDNGSSWVRHAYGSESDPGLLVFNISAEKGFELRSLEIL